MEYSITRALSELKLLHTRIERAVNEASFIITYKMSAKKVNNIDNPAEFADKAKASYQSINDLIERRKKIKSAIVESNAITLVKIGGVEMTVANAIERKESIKYELALLANMEKQYNQMLALAQRNNEAVQFKLDELLIASFGKESKGKVSEDEIASISKPYLEQNEFVVLDELKLGDKIKALKESIETFNAEVDFTLSTANCLTMIEVAD